MVHYRILCFQNKGRTRAGHLFQLLEKQVGKITSCWSFGRLVVFLGLVGILSPQSSFGSFSEAPELQVRLKTRLASYRSKPGDRFECVVLTDWVVNDRVVIPEGATVHGRVGRVTSVGIGVRHERARMELAFEDFVTPDGQSFPLYAKLSAIDNAREEVTGQGVIRGVVAAEQPNELIFGWWSSPSLPMLSRTLVGLTGVSHLLTSALSLGPAGAGGLLALRLTLMRFPEPEIQYSSGTDLRLRVNAAEQRGIGEVPALPLTATEEVAEWLGKEPFGIDRRDNRPVGDIVNVAFLGSREQVTQAFTAAGWVQADAPTRRTKKQAYYAYNAMRAYATAPVSPLLYKGTLPEMVFEKSLNTITKRHHIRIWYTGVVDGRELWMGAATHDTGGTFSVHSFKFTHKIDPNVDDERDKVAVDLHFAGCVDPIMQVERPAAAAEGLDRRIITDGVAKVLALNDCQTTAAASDELPKPGNPVSRLTRRMILQARNHVERENPYYWTYQFVKRSLHHSNAQALTNN